MDLTIYCKTAYCQANGKEIQVELSDATAKDVFENFTAKEAADHFDHEDLLKHIDISTVKEYFGLVDPE